MMNFSAFLLCCFLANLQWVGCALAENCYLAKEGFAVEQPYMVTKSCFLFRHGSNIDLANQSEMVVSREGEYDADPLHSEFIRSVVERKLIALKKGTPIFSCEYDLPTVSRDYKYGGSSNNKTRTLGYDLPQFNCYGVTSMWAPVRPVYESHCFWIAVPLIHCDVIGSELEPMSVMDPDPEKEE